MFYNARKSDYFLMWGAIMPDETEWLTIEDIYEILGRKVPMDSIREWIRTKRLRAYRPGKAYLVKREDLDEFLRRSQTDREDS